MDPVVLAPVLFFFVALVFSMLGMGGGQLYVPILFWMGFDFTTQAVPLGILLNVVVGGSSTVTYVREQLVDWRIGIPFGLAMVVFAPLGAYATTWFPTDTIVAVLALFTAAAAVFIASGYQPRQGIGFSRREETGVGLGGGSALGFFAGLIGQGGGVFVVPLLYMLGIEAKVAAATSALVITGAGLSSVVSHLAIASTPIWDLWIGSAVAVLLGSQVGSRLMATRLESKTVKKIFGVVLFGIAIVLLYQAFGT
ncbi:MAG: sulfite exporter TauE/SafE family protein [Halapricum sp.]